jgi:pilus assembly protein Flp/PilA
MKYLLQLLTGAERMLQKFPLEDRGATATEYSLLAGFIALVIVVGVGVFGLALNGVFTSLGTGLKTALGIP